MKLCTGNSFSHELYKYASLYLMPLVNNIYYYFWFLCSGIQKQISTSSLIRKFVALTFIRISLGYMEYKRIYEVWSSALYILVLTFVKSLLSFFLLFCMYVLNIMWLGTMERKYINLLFGLTFWRANGDEQNASPLNGLNAMT